MSNGKKIEGAELRAIQYMLKNGKSIAAIAKMTDRCPTSIRRVASKMDYKVKPRPVEKANQYLREWLQENWRWEIPERNPKMVVKKPVRPKTLITPYHYPAMYKYEENS